MQLPTAVTHAQNAAGSESLRTGQSHLVHVVNCLEGPRGRNFNSGDANPCQGQGNGVIPDLRGLPGGGAWAPVADSAAELALRASRMNDAAAVRASARGVAALLTAAAEGLR